MTDIGSIALQLKLLKDALSHAGIDIAEVRLAAPQDGVELEALMNSRGLELIREELGIPNNGAMLADVLITWPTEYEGRNAN